VTLHAALYVGCLIAAAYQVWRVPRLWTFLLLFVALMPKVPLAVVPGNTTPIRIDDLVVGAALAGWIVRRRDVPPSPATFFLLVYWYAAAIATLIGIAALTTAPLTGVLHVARLIEYGLLYFLFYSSIGSDDLHAFVEVVRTSLLLVCAIWLAQHWTHAPLGGPDSPWATLYPTFSATYDFGGFLMLTTVMLYALWTTGADRSVWTTMALAAGAFVTANSDSRGSLLGFAIVVGVDVLLRARWWGVLLAGIAAAAALAAAPYVLTSKKMLTLVAGVVALVTTLDVGVIRQAFATDLSLALRLRNWRVAIEHWLARPFFGDGLGGYLSYTRQYDQPAPPDGWYVRVLADTGVVGLTAFVLMIGGLLWTLSTALGRETDPLRRAMVYGASLAVVAASISAILVDTFVSYKIMGVFWMMVAVGTRVAAEPASQPA
jgi:hypothetical protein